MIAHVPKDLNLNINPYDNMTDEQIMARLKYLRETVPCLRHEPTKRQPDPRPHDGISCLSVRAPASDEDEGARVVA